METFEHIVSLINSYLWGWPMIIALLGTHIFLTLRLRFPQRKVWLGIKYSLEKDKAEGDVSQFSSLMIALAATIGTGNIVGVATAVSLGGAGAVFWCWVTGILGMATKYAEGFLAIQYRQKNSDGKMIGGPMMALEKGVGSKWLAVVFCVFTVLASFGIGNMVQANTLSTVLNQEFGFSPSVTGIVMAGLVALVIIFGIRGIANACASIVPAMAILYVGGCIVILIFNRAFLGETLRVIFSEAFSLQAMGGGFLGSTIMVAMRFGIARGLFSNESGMGSAPIAAAAAKTSNAVRQALVSSTGTFWDTVVVCAITGLVIVSSIIAHPDITISDGATLTKTAFSKIPYIGMPLLITGLTTFIFSTLIGWSYYGEKAIEYLGGLKSIKYYRLAWVIAIYFGAVMKLSLVWDLADVMNALMAIPNIIALVVLSGVVVKGTDKNLWGR